MHSLKVSSVSSAPSVITQASTYKTGRFPGDLFFICSKKKKEKSHINNLQFEQPFSFILTQNPWLFPVG